MELLFLKFDFQLIELLLKFVIANLRDHVFDNQTEACNCINALNEFVYFRMKQ